MIDSHSTAQIATDENYVAVKVGKGCIALFLKEEFARAIKRGKSILRNRSLRKRQEKQESEWEMGRDH